MDLPTDIWGIVISYLGTVDIASTVVCRAAAIVCMPALREIRLATKIDELKDRHAVGYTLDSMFVCKPNTVEASRYTTEYVLRCTSAVHIDGLNMTCTPHEKCGILAISSRELMYHVFEHNMVQWLCNFGSHRASKTQYNAMITGAAKDFVFSKATVGRIMEFTNSTHPFGTYTIFTPTPSAETISAADAIATLDIPIIINAVTAASIHSLYVNRAKLVLLVAKHNKDIKP